MEDREQIIKFKNINIVEYLNKTHKTPDTFLIETQKHNLKKYMKELNNELYKSFVSNSDDLLTILNTYDFCFGMLSSINVPRTTHDGGSSPSTLLNCKEFERKATRFEDDLSPYMTEARYLVSTEYFNDKKYYAILTNDILFLGQRIHGEEKKYRLKHAFAKSIVDMKLHENYIALDVDGIKYTFTGEQSSLTDFYDLFVDTSYFEQNEAQEINKELITYFVMTEQLEKLADYVSKFPHVTIKTENIKPRNERELGQLMRISQDRNKTFLSFVSRSFEEGVLCINKIQPLDQLISELFDFLYEFLDGLFAIHARLEMEGWTANLMVESFISILFNSIEKRIFNKFYELKITNENLKLIKSKLKFKDLNYGYMFDRLLGRKEGFSKRCIEITKHEIDELLNRFISAEK